MQQTELRLHSAPSGRETERSFSVQEIGQIIAEKQQQLASILLFFMLSLKQTVIHATAQREQEAQK